ncbi:MAG TPA: hypothetical protein DCE41_36825 [Cytophagales bacterium]|nr:hypothetical protein [Cytophagales bacterium]
MLPRTLLFSLVLTSCVRPLLAQSSLALDALDGANGFVVQGIGAGDLAGRGVTVADLDNDGKNDLIIGANGVDFGEVSSAGEVYVIWGKNTPGPVLDLAAATSDQVLLLQGTTQQASVGGAVHVLDFNHDGIDDLAVGATGEEGITGSCYVLFGGPEWAERDTVALSQTDSYAGVQLIGAGFGHNLGWGLGSGDLNGDGREDLIMGATGVAEFSGGVYVVYGQEAYSRQFKLDTLKATEGLRLEGNDPFGQLGANVDAADVNDDGIDDLICGVYTARLNEEEFGGRGYVLFGNDALPDSLHVSQLVGNQGLTFIGGPWGFTAPFVSTGDFNQDGIADLVYSAERGSTSPDWINSGRVHIVYGGSHLDTLDSLYADSLEASLGFYLRGEGAEYVGMYPVAGDFTGDGLDDLLFGNIPDPFNQPERTGDVYLVNGAADLFTHPEPFVPLAGLEETALLRISGLYSGQFPGRINAIGDVDTDGENDLITVALEGSPQDRFRAGEVFVFYGPISFADPDPPVDTTDDTDTTITDLPESLSKEWLVLGQNYPNPFSHTTRIPYALREGRSVELTLYNHLGQRVAHQVLGHQPAGSHTTLLELFKLPPGIYYYQVKAGPYRQTRRMVYTKP